ncbi:MAG: ABC transporter substrate-binding protein [Geobacteraceae bacterium]|nr:ABC transporter substrate-binding protein [Geobacteraceae bacterium]
MTGIPLAVSRTFPVFITVLFLLAASALQGAAAERTLKKATLIPLWSPQAQFAGYYTALEKGIYRKHGIDLTIIGGGPNYSSAEYLRRGKADFAVMWLTTAMQERASGVKLANIAQIIQKSSMMLVARKSSGITTPADMNGRKIGLWGGDFAIPPHAFFRKFHIRVREVPQSYTVNLFLRGGIDVASAMWYNEYHTIINAGIDPDELKVFFLKDEGLNLPEDGLYALEKTLKSDPGLAGEFARASLEGWNYAFAHPEEALDIIMKYMRAAKIPANRMHQKWMLARIRDLVVPRGGGSGYGMLSRSDYEEAGEILVKNGVIRETPGFGAFAWRPDAER